MDFNQLDLFVWLALWSLSLWLNTSMHPLKNPGVLRNCQDLYLIFLFPFLLVWCTVNFEPVYVKKVNSSFAEGLLGRYRFAQSQREMSKQSGNRCNYKLWIYTAITNGSWKRFDLQKILYFLTFTWILPSSSLLRSSQMFWLTGKREFLLYKTFWLIMDQDQTILRSLFVCL